MEGSDNDGKSINSIKMNVNNQRRVEYDPENMWFDYQALFDQTKNWVLHYDFKIEEFKTIPVQHTDFEKNTLSKKVLFGDKVDNELINSVCNGFVPEIFNMVIKLFNYAQLEKYKGDREKIQKVWYNFLLLLAIKVQFTFGNNNGFYYKYVEIAGILNNSYITLSEK